MGEMYEGRVPKGYVARGDDDEYIDKKYHSI